MGDLWLLHCPAKRFLKAVEHQNRQSIWTPSLDMVLLSAEKGLTSYHYILYFLGLKFFVFFNLYIASIPLVFLDILSLFHSHFVIQMQTCQMIQAGLGLCGITNTKTDGECQICCE